MSLTSQMASKHLICFTVLNALVFVHADDLREMTKDLNQTVRFVLNLLIM